MNVRHYAPFFDDASYHLWTMLGLPYSVMIEKYGVHCVTASATTNFIQELVGGDLIRSESTNGKAPTFLVRATKDPEGANLDRVQIIKGWRDESGKLQEKVHDVAWSGHRKIDADGLPSVGSTVNLEDASYKNTIGSPELSATWSDPDFDETERAVYYVRVLQIPTPRWTVYDAKFYGVDFPQSPPPVIEERAYSSPVWYTPR